MRKGFLGNPEQGENIHFKCLSQLLRGNVLNVLHRYLLAGHQGQNVQAAKFFQSVPDEFLTEGFIAEVARQQNGVPPFLPDELRHFLGIALFFGKVVQGYVGSFACIRNGGRTAYA